MLTLMAISAERGLKRGMGIWALSSFLQKKPDMCQASLHLHAIFKRCSRFSRQILRSSITVTSAIRQIQARAAASGAAALIRLDLEIRFQAQQRVKAGADDKVIINQRNGAHVYS